MKRAFGILIATSCFACSDSHSQRLPTSTPPPTAAPAPAPVPTPIANPKMHFRFEVLDHSKPDQQRVFLDYSDSAGVHSIDTHLDGSHCNEGGRSSCSWDPDTIRLHAACVGVEAEVFKNDKNECALQVRNVPNPDGERHWQFIAAVACPPPGMPCPDFTN